MILSPSLSNTRRARNVQVTPLSRKQDDKNDIETYSEPIKEIKLEKHVH